MAKTEVTEADVERSRREVEKLRKLLKDEQAKLAVKEASGTNALRKETLDAEADRLRAQLEAAKEAVKLSVSAPTPAEVAATPAPLPTEEKEG